MQHRLSASTAAFAVEQIVVDAFLTNAAGFIHKGAPTLGSGGGLINQQLLEEGDMDKSTCRATVFIAAVKEGRGDQAA